MAGQATTVPEYLELMQTFKSEEALAYCQAFSPRPDDVLVATFAKAGTTWMQQIVHGLKSGGDMNFREITQVVPWIETAYDLGIDLDADQLGGQRAFKTHLDWHEVPKGCRYICVIRDPADSAMSFYNFMDGWFLERGAVSPDDLIRDFYVMPYLNGGYWNHLMSWWGHRDDPEVLLMAFEDIKADHAGTVRRVAKFLSLDHDAAAIDVATRQSTFEFMKQHESHFDDNLLASARNRAMGLPADAGSTKVNTGRVGDHKAGLSTESLALLDEMWASTIGEELGFADYAELRAALNGADA